MYASVAHSGYYSNMNKWKWCIGEGVVLFILGIFAIAKPGLAAIAVEQVFAWLLIIGGAFSLFGGLTSQTGPRAPVSIAGGVVAVICGILLLLLPIEALATITILVAIFFLISGIAEIASSFALRSVGHDSHWALAFFNGLIGVMLGILLIALWPDSIDIIGLLLGINFLLSGAYLTSLGWHFRHAPSS